MSTNLTVWGVCALLNAARHGDHAVAAIGEPFAGRVRPFADVRLSDLPRAYERMALMLAAERRAMADASSLTVRDLRDLHAGCAYERRVEHELTTPVAWH